MSEGYDTPTEVWELEKLINDFSYRHGFGIRDVFRDFLRYVVHGFSMPGTPPMEDWKYSQQQNKSFYEMFAVWVQIMERQIDSKDWYDAFGDLYMALMSKRGQQQRGQFFTPANICDLMGSIIGGKEKPASTICDPTCGSGRNLLSGNHNRPKSYMVGYDIDYTCCLMTVCNFLIHGCVGEVVCIDTLRMSDFRGAWMVNEALSRTGVPSVRSLDEEEYARLQRANIPPYVYFLDQKSYDQYFHDRELWQKISNLFNDGKFEK